MPDRSISSLETVDLRTVWADESQHFTPWLAKPANLARLGEALGLTLEPHRTEQQVGSFSADILCRRPSGGDDDESWVVIENQYGRTNHDHLGKLLTYTAGLDARTVVWVAEKFRDEHRAALDLLNDSTTQDYAYFGIEIELLKIDNSRPAPRFNVVVQPNDWAQTVKRTGFDSELSETKRHQLDFWTGFQRVLETEGGIPATRPTPTAYMTHQVPVAGVRVVSFFTAWNSARETFSIGELRVALEFYGSDRKTNFDKFSQSKELIEHDAGQSYLWQPLESESTHRILVRKDAEIKARQYWPGYQAWLKAEVKRMFDVVVPKALEAAT